MATWNMSFDNSKQYSLNLKCLHDSLPTMVVMHNRHPYLYSNTLCRGCFANVADDDEIDQIEDTDHVCRCPVSWAARVSV